jgi:phenylacetate-coenzyme A ligase PaaK-like adenylate-forming protein
LGRYWVNATSGSTGRRGLFLFDAREWATVIAGFGRANQWAGFEGSLLRRKRIATVSSSAPWHISYRIMATVASSWVPMLRLDASESAGSLVEALNGWKPHLLAGYPSALRLLAGEQLAGRLRIHPEKLYTGGEVLSEETRRLALDAWGTDVFDQYGTTEAGDLASECRRHRGLHINEDLVIVEPVDEAYRSVPPGHFGDKLLITVLFNRTQPLIRYELSDRVKLAVSRCGCSKPYALIDAIQGRAEEMLEFPSVSGGLTAVHPLVFERILDGVPAAEWQVIQEQDRILVLLAGVKEGFQNETVSESLLRELAAHGVVPPVIEVNRVPTIPRGLTGKAPIIKRGVRP